MALWRCNLIHSLSLSLTLGHCLHADNLLKEARPGTLHEVFSKALPAHLEARAKDFQFVSMLSSKRIIPALADVLHPRKFEGEVSSDDLGDKSSEESEAGAAGQLGSECFLRLLCPNAGKIKSIEVFIPTVQRGHSSKAMAFTVHEALEVDGDTRAVCTKPRLDAGGTGRIVLMEALPWSPSVRENLQGWPSSTAGKELMFCFSTSTTATLEEQLKSLRVWCLLALCLTARQRFLCLRTKRPHGAVWRTKVC